jgi:uncharacterized protein (DUF1330 family)
MAGYMIVQMTVSDPEQFQRYREAVTPLLERHGGRLIVRGAVEVLEGGHDGRELLMIEFPSLDALHAFWDDPAYVPIKAMRRDAAVLDVWATSSL